MTVSPAVAALVEKGQKALAELGASAARPMTSARAATDVGVL
ncbi:MAG: hypothetical protein Q7S95_00620 [bacterium]|nr:hypothetical protein [bacterium]